jgi:hypothetical protein
MVKKHTPLFSGLDSVERPFLVSVKPFVPNKLKYVVEPVLEFDNIDHGMYFLMPEEELSFTQMELIEKDVLNFMETGSKTSCSLKLCKSFSSKFRDMKQSLYFNSFSVRDRRLYLNNLKLIVDKKPISFTDYQVLISHLVNYYITCTKIGHDSPFFAKTLEKNVEILNLKFKSDTISVEYTHNRFSNSPILNIKSDMFNYMFESSDTDSLLEFLMPVLYSMYKEDTEISRYLEYKS